MDMNENCLMSKEKKTPKLSEDVKNRDADKFCMPMEGLIIKDPNGNVIKLDIKKK